MTNEEDKEKIIKEHEEKIRKFKEEQIKNDILTEKAITEILMMTIEDWKGTIKVIEKDNINFYVGDFFVKGKRYNMNSFLETLNKEEIEVFINLLLIETKRFLGLLDLK